MEYLRKSRCSVLVTAAAVVMVVVVFGCGAVEGLRFEIESGHTKCITEEIKSEAMTVGKYNVVNPSETLPLPSDSHRVNVRVISPNGNKYNYHSADQVSEGNFAFHAGETGDYITCFTAANHKPQTTITLEFEWKSGVATKDWTNVVKKGSVDVMQMELTKLMETVQNIQSEMFYLRSREDEMQMLNIATNSKMAWMSLGSLLICLMVAGMQFWHLKSFFEKKKII